MADKSLRTFYVYIMFINRHDKKLLLGLGMAWFQRLGAMLGGRLSDLEAESRRVQPVETVVPRVGHLHDFINHCVFKAHAVPEEVRIVIFCEAQCFDDHFGNPI